MTGALSATAVVVAAAVVVALVVVVVLVRRYRVASPSEALIVVGRRKRPVYNPEVGDATMDLSGQKVVIGGGVFIKPFVERVSRISLVSRRVSFTLDGAISKTGITLDLEAVAIVKIGGNDTHVRAAAQRFLNQQDAIEPFTKEVLAGSLRSIVGTLTVDQIISDRVAFAEQVEAESKASLENQGLVLDTFQIQDVRDKSDYLRNLGRPQAAEVAQRAAVAEAEADRSSKAAQNAAAVAIAETARDRAVRVAQDEGEQATAAAESRAAGDLAQAAQAQRVLEQQELVAQRRAALTERELDTQVRKPADAARYQAVQEAEAAKAAAIAAAEGDAQRVRLAAAAELARRTAEAQAVRLEGEAAADAARARGDAEGSALAARAAGFASFGEAAQAQMVVDVLPQVAAELARPMASIDALTVVSTEGAGALTRTVANSLGQLFDVVRTSTGIDVAQLLAARAPASPTGAVGGGAVAGGGGAGADGAVVSGATPAAADGRDGAPAR